MNDILGILIPMLISGSSVGDIIKALGGVGTGAATMDGLSAMMSEQARNRRREIPLVQDQTKINMAAESLLDFLGIVPTSGLGQGLASMIGGMYHVAPDIVGSIIGVPNARQFFGNIANGAYGISQAATGMTPDIFNPYSMMDAHRGAMRLAQQVYGMGTRPDGGYNVSFSHGLNMNEMGTVTQRLLSSRIPYVDEEGRRLNLSVNEEGKYRNEDDAERFSQNLKRLGSKFNETVSMLSKITGSVEEAINLMDRMAGGNFLGGTEKQASDIANKARNMAAAVRITAAMSGMNPQEVYSQIHLLNQNMIAATGVDPTLATATGVNEQYRNMANNGVMSYAMWAAMNPNASQFEKNRALAGTTGRAQAYAQSSASRLAAAVVANKELFSGEELDNAVRMFSEGRADEFMATAQKRIGYRRLNEMLSDPATALATREKAGKIDSGLLNRIDDAGIYGNLPEAKAWGARMSLQSLISDAGMALYSASREYKLDENVRNAEREFLVGKAREAGFTGDFDKNMSNDEIAKTVKKIPGIDAAKFERERNTAMIRAVKEQIDSQTMSPEEENEAKRQMTELVTSNTKEGSAMQKQYLRQIREGDLRGVWESAMEWIPQEKRLETEKQLLGGKLTSREAETLKERFAPLEATQRPEYTTEERLKRMEQDARARSVTDAGKIKSEILAYDKAHSSPDTVVTDEESLDNFRKNYLEFGKTGGVEIDVGDERLDKLTKRGAEMMLMGAIGSEPGNVRAGGIKVADLRSVAEKAAKLAGTGKKEKDDYSEVIAQAAKEAGVKIEPAEIGAVGQKDVRRAGLEAALRDVYGDAITDEQRKSIAKQASDLYYGGGKESGNNFKALSKALSEANVVGVDVDKLKTARGALGDKSIQESGVMRILSERKGIDSGEFFGEFADMLTKGVRSGKMTSDSAREAITSLVKEYGNVLGEGGIRHLMQKADDLGREDSQTEKRLNVTTWKEYMASVGDQETRDRRVRAVEEMTKLIQGENGNLNNREAFGEFVDLFERTRSEPGEIESQEIRRKYLGDKLGIGGKKLDAAVEKFNEIVKKDGNYQAAAEEVAREFAPQQVDFSDAAKALGTASSDDMKTAISSLIGEKYKNLNDEQKSALAEEAVKRYSKTKDIEASIYESVKGKKSEFGINPDEAREITTREVMQKMVELSVPEGVRTSPEDTWNAGIASKTANGAALSMAAAETYATGGRMLLGTGALTGQVDDIAALDDINAEATLNRVSNAIKVGEGASYYQEAIKETSSKIAELGEVLRKPPEGVDAFTAKDFEYVAGVDQSEEGKKRTLEAEKKFEAAFAGRSDKDVAMNLVKSVYDKKIGGKDGVSAVDVMLGGKEAVEKAMKMKGAGSDVLDITRETNQRGSDMYKILDGISQLVQGLSKITDSPTGILGSLPKPLPIVITNDAQIAAQITNR